MTYRRFGFVAGVGAALLALSVSAAHADARGPTPGCRKPYKPYRFNDQSEREDYQGAVNAFRGCMAKLIERQR